jgi:glycosyltransferase involved in cell wall biosynthesis
MVTFGSVIDAQGGVQTRARMTAETFADMGVPMKVVSTREPPNYATPGWASALKVPARKPRKGFSRQFASLIREEAASSNVIFATNAMFMPVLAAARSRLPLVWDTNECQTLHYQRLPRTFSNRVKHAVWFGLERWAARRCSLAIAIGEEEATRWRSHHPCLEDKLAVVDHATLATERDPSMARHSLEGRLGRPATGPILLFLGTLRAKHNAVAAQWIIDELAGALPEDVTLVLCGPGTENLPAGPSEGASLVTLGSVEDVDEVVAAADLCLAPLASGAGVKTKVLHYLAHGKPVLGTPTAFEGLAGAPGLHVAELEDFADAARELCREREAAEVATERSRAQKAWVEVNHGRTHVTQQWRMVLSCL